MKNKNASIAEHSLTIIRDGKYLFNSSEINVKEKINHCVLNTYTLNPDQSNDLINGFPFEKTSLFSTEITIENSTTIEAILNNKSQLKTVVLNFASAKNPGGGFMGGASAQEESLARSSALYASLTKETTMYKFNKGNASFLYSDYMIYSPDVPFWMNDQGEALDQPVSVNVITCPAPNKGAILQHKRTEELNQLDGIFKIRIEKILALALKEKIECIILGAWGCGVFRNDPKDVAGFFQEIIEQKFKNHFRKIVFAIYDRSENKPTYLTFKNLLEKI